VLRRTNPWYEAVPPARHTVLFAPVFSPASSRRRAKARAMLADSLIRNHRLKEETLEATRCPGHLLLSHYRRSLHFSAISAPSASVDGDPSLPSVLASSGERGQLHSSRVDRLSRSEFAWDR